MISSMKNKIAENILIEFGVAERSLVNFVLTIFNVGILFFNNNINYDNDLMKMISHTLLWFLSAINIFIKMELRTIYYLIS